MLGRALQLRALSCTSPIDGSIVVATATLSDSYWLSQSGVFKNRVQTALMTYCNTVETEAITGVTGTMPSSVHQARMNFIKTILSPNQFSSWLPQFVMAAAADGNVIAAATQASSTYVAITSIALGDQQAADGQTPIVSATLISNAVAAAFNTFVPGV